MVDDEETYSPPVTLFVPKLLPTRPVQRHVLPAAFVHVAVAVAPIFRHDTARLPKVSTGEAAVRATVAKIVRTVYFMVIAELRIRRLD